MHNHFHQQRYYFDAETPGSPVASRPSYHSAVDYRYNEHYPTPQYINHPYHDKPESHRRRQRNSSSLMMAEPPISPHENDVLMGRGGKNNQHSGNERLRTLARTQSAKYRVSTKKGKSQISRDLVNRMRGLRPPARFLKRDSDTGGWVDVGDDVAREKASQVLRDAVALLQDGEEPETTTTPLESNDDSAEQATFDNSEIDDGGANLDGKVGPREEDVVSSSRHHTPGLVSSSSFPPPSPIENSRKRQRYPQEAGSEPLLYDPETMESPSRRHRSNDQRDRSVLWNYNAVTSSSHSHRPSRSLDGDLQRPPYEDYSRRSYGSQDFMPPPAPSSSHRYQPPASSPRVRYAQHPDSYYGSEQVSTRSIPGQWVAKKSHPSTRPQSVAARQASTASCQSLLGDVNGGTSGDFDLFGGELVLDVDNPGKKNSTTAPKAPSPR